jgi:hypothetical protein
MKLKPLSDSERTRRLLEVVPNTFRAEVAKTLRIIEISSWLAGWDAAASDASLPSRADEVAKLKAELGFGADDLYIGNPERR